MWGAVFMRAVPEVPKDRCVFVFRIKQSEAAQLDRWRIRDCNLPKRREPLIQRRGVTPRKMLMHNNTAVRTWKLLYPSSVEELRYVLCELDMVDNVDILDSVYCLQATEWVLIMTWSVVDHFSLNVQTLPSRDQQIFENVWVDCRNVESTECQKCKLWYLISVPVLNNWVLN